MKKFEELNYIEKIEYLNNKIKDIEKNIQYVKEKIVWTEKEQEKYNIKFQKNKITEKEYDRKCQEIDDYLCDLHYLGTLYHIFK